MSSVNVLFLVGRAHRRKKNALFVQRIWGHINEHFWMALGTLFWKLLKRMKLHNFMDTFWTCFWTILLFKRMKLHNWSNIKCSVHCLQSTSGQEECTFRAKVYGVMGTFSNQPCAADKCQEKAKKVGDWKTRFRNDCYRCSTSVLVFGCWLMNEHVIYLKLRPKMIVVTSRTN